MNSMTNTLPVAIPVLDSQVHVYAINVTEEEQKENEEQTVVNVNVIQGQRRDNFVLTRSKFFYSLFCFTFFIAFLFFVLLYPYV
jgi:hypothetical protein